MEEGEDFIEIETPIIEFETVQLGRIALSWFNTTMKLFQDTRYDHVRYMHDGQSYAFIPTSQIQDELFEHDYPTDYRPVVDSSTKGWYLGNIAMIFKEVDEILEDE